MDGKRTRGRQFLGNGRNGHAAAPEAGNAGTSGSEVLRGGDARAAAGDWVGAIRRWRAAAADGAEEEARARLYAFVRRNEGDAPSRGDHRLPTPALRALALLLTASLVGTLAFIIAGRGDRADTVLLAVGWSAVVIATTASLLFAATSGRLGGTGQPGEFWATAATEELAMRAEMIAARQSRHGEDPSSRSVLATR